MRILRKLVYVCCSITLGLMALSSCEGGELYDVNAPDWISEKVDSIADSKKEPEVLSFRVGGRLRLRLCLYRSVSA